MRAEVSDTIRYIHLHKIAIQNEAICRVLPAVHVLGGSYYTSKIGTKLSALKQIQLVCCQSSRKNIADPNQEHIWKQSKEYLVMVLKLTTSCKLMDEL